MRGIVWFEPHDVEMLQEASGGLTMGGTENACAGGKEGYIFLSFSELLVQLVSYNLCLVCY